MLPVNVLWTPHTLATPFWDMRLGSGVSLAVMERLRKLTPPAHGVRVGVLAPEGALPYWFTGVEAAEALLLCDCTGVEYAAATKCAEKSRTASPSAIISRGQKRGDFLRCCRWGMVLSKYLLLCCLFPTWHVNEQNDG